MADLGMEFDHTQVDPDEGREFDLLPNGRYVAEITDSDVKETKSGSGRYMALTFTITDGPFVNRKVWANINYQNRSEEAQRIGQAQLSAICLAVGHMGPLTDTAQLHSIPLEISIGVEKDKTGQNPDRNKVTKFASLNGAPAATQPQRQPQRQAAPAQTRPAPTSRPAPASTGGGKMAWPSRAAAPR